MSLCPKCEGPVTHCQNCRHWHCDDEACIEMPIVCARWCQAEETG